VTKNVTKFALSRHGIFIFWSDTFEKKNKAAVFLANAGGPFSSWTTSWQFYWVLKDQLSI